MVGVLRFELKASASRTQRATNCAIPRKKTAADAAVWLRKKDSNPHNASQSRRCCRYTIPLRQSVLYALLKEKSTPIVPFVSQFITRHCSAGGYPIWLFPRSRLTVAGLAYSDRTRIPNVKLWVFNRKLHAHHRIELVGDTGLEPATSTMST